MNFIKTNSLKKINPDFIQLVPFLKSFFKKHTFKIITQSPDVIRNEIKSYRINNIVRVNNELVTCNLRMIASYFPEKLAMLSFKTLKKPQSLQSLIEELSKEEFIYSPPKFANRVFQYRFTDLLEAFIFSDFFESIWNGNLNSNRCFVIKENSELKYYNYYQSKMLAEIICDNIILKSKFLKSVNNIICMELHFTLDKKFYIKNKILVKNK